jgi:hypothetical protein
MSLDPNHIDAEALVSMAADKDPHVLVALRAIERHSAWLTNPLLTEAFYTLKYVVESPPVSDVLIGETQRLANAMESYFAEQILIKNGRLTPGREIPAFATKECLTPFHGTPKEVVRLDTESGSMGILTPFTYLNELASHVKKAESMNAAGEALLRMTPHNAPEVVEQILDAVAKAAGHHAAAVAIARPPFDEPDDLAPFRAYTDAENAERTRLEALKNEIGLGRASSSSMTLG